MNILPITKVKIKYLRKVKVFLPKIKTRKNTFGIDEEGSVHFVYCIINKKNGNFYIGKHTSKGTPISYSEYTGSNKHLKNSIVKNGLAEFFMLIIKYFRTSEAAYAYEEKILTQALVSSIYCYNMQGGGKGFAAGNLNAVHALVAAGTHNLLKRADGTSHASDQIAKGINHFKRRKDGTSLSKDRVLRNTHNFLAIKPWDQYSATKNSKAVWYFAKEIFKIKTTYPDYGIVRIARELSDIAQSYNLRFSISPMDYMLRKFKQGWIPFKDKEWKRFRRTYAIN